MTTTPTTERDILRMSDSDLASFCVNNGVEGVPDITDDEWDRAEWEAEALDVVAARAKA